VKIDHQVEVLRAQPAAEFYVLQQATKAAASGDDDDVVERWVVGDYRRGERLDHVADVGVGKVLAKSPNRGGRKDDVSDLAQADEENAQIS
jgi:hypothetical protein